MENEFNPSEEELALFNKRLQAALDFVSRLYMFEVEQEILLKQNEHTLQHLEYLDHYIQATYYGNIRNGKTEDAIVGLMSGVRAAFIYGYMQAGIDNQMDFESEDREFTPLLGYIGDYTSAA